MKTTITLHHPCPQCHEPMRPVALSCSTCHLELKANIETNPYMELSQEWLHFLNVFIMCEGKISDVEKALGVSYPTVKAKIQTLKQMVSKNSEPRLTIVEVLKQIEVGAIDYTEGLELIQKIKKQGE